MTQPKPAPDESIRRFARLGEIACDIHALSALAPSWPDGAVDRYDGSGRPEDMLFYMLQGRRSYFPQASRQPFEAQAGDILFVPAGSCYLTRCRTERQAETSTGICIKFSLTDEQGQPIKLGDQPFLLAHDQQDHFKMIFKNTLADVLQGVGGRIAAKARVYCLLKDLASSVNQDHFKSGRFAAGYPAIQIIEQKPQEHHSLSELARLCHLSESSLRRLFLQYAGLPPHAYRNRLRVDKVDELLRSGLYSVEGAAAALGFTDSSHLCKVYRRLKGVSPGYKRTTTAPLC